MPQNVAALSYINQHSTDAASLPCDFLWTTSRLKQMQFELNCNLICNFENVANANVANCCSDAKDSSFSYIILCDDDIWDSDLG